VAVVTGAGSGIGRATARRLAAEGGAVACLDLAEDAVEAVAGEINEEARDAGGRAIAVRCDVTDEGAVAAAVARAKDEPASAASPTHPTNRSAVGTRSSPST
jgi:3-oxoacyl-[acyl-carrier protein] reductase